jgi:tRNA wybutosine-synthesizing protein 1
MMELLTLWAVCATIYLASGGRWTIVLVVTTGIYLLQDHEAKHPRRTKADAKKESVYAIDFTTTSGATDRGPRPLPTKKMRRASRAPRIIKGGKPKTLSSPPVGKQFTSSSVTLLQSQVYIFYTTLTGSSQRIARGLLDKIAALPGLERPPKLLSLDDDVDDLEEYFMRTPASDELVKNVYLLVLPSYEQDSPIDYFLEHLKDTYNDFRVDKYPLKALLGFAVLGLGDSESWGEEDKFCYQAKSADRWLGKLGGRRLYPMGNVCMKYEGEPRAHEWFQGFATLMNDNEPFLMDENHAELEDSDAEGDDNSEEDVDADTLVDVEDMGDVMKRSGGSLLTPVVKEMVAKDSPTYKSLTKQGYTIVGSHSGVKICRWTKSALRGRGSCYKFAFYGIKSHLCMETTPSLACANKCVFCWRHGTNPVAKLNWRWSLDPPEKVFEGALEGHYQKIKQMRGVPGIQLDRFQEAFKVRHCALSLVGEPIFYPHINELVGMLHRDHISSFLVCNAQHPKELARLARVTQLYVSIDAPTKQDLKKVDRPLNGDFWERLLACLDILRTTQAHQRTVFRLTLVKGFNMTDVKSYADMVERAQPSQIEIKGATFCGSSNGNGNPLTMQNIPFYDECKTFVESLAQELQSRGQDYEIAAEHAHSCCILMAHTKFKIEGVWHTHIDYPRFFELLESGQDFVDLDYVKPTPEWAIWGSDGAGFNPEDTRFDRKAEKLKNKLDREAKAACV